VPCIVRDMTTAEIEEARLIENLQREDLNAIDEARAFHKYLNDVKTTQAELAKKIGKSQPYIANRLRLLDLRPEVQDHISRGMLSASAGEVLLEIPKEASDLQGQVAKALVKNPLPVKDLKRELEWKVKRWKADQEQRDAQSEAKKHKFPKCPSCTSFPKTAEKVVEVGGRTILEHGSYDWDRHRWDADSGERYLTPAERKALERRNAEQARIRKEASKRSAASRKDKVSRAYATFFSRASGAQWAQALLDAAKKEGISGLQVGGWGSLGVDILGKSQILTTESVDFDVVDVPEGNGGKFRTRLTISGYTSLSNGTDHVAESGHVAHLRKQVREVLAFQRERVKLKQDVGDIYPVAVDGFRLGEKVRLGEKAAWSSYKGKQGAILAFDFTTNIGTGYYGGSGGKRGWAAVLDIGAAHKIHWVASLEHIEKKAAKKGKAK